MKNVLQQEQKKLKTYNTKNMRTKIYLMMSLLLIIQTVNAQQWTGPNNTTDDISRSGNVATSNMIQLDGYGINKAQIRLNSQGNYWGMIGTPQGDVWSLGYSTNGTDLNSIFNWTAIGHVGIGTISPSNIQGWDRVLDATGPANAKIIATAGNTAIRTGIYSNQNWNGAAVGLVGTETNHNLYFMAGYDAKMALTTAGNFGIGTTSPTHKLTVVGPENNFKARFQGNDGYIEIGPANSTWAHIYTDRPGFIFNQNIWSMGSFSSYNTDLLLQAHGTTRMKIANATGNVGIGTLSPRGRLDVTGGDVYLSDDPNVGTSQSLYLPGHILVSPYAGTNISYLQARRLNNSGTTALRIRTYNNGNLSEAMHIEGNGNVGIGTTAPADKLHIAGGSIILEHTNPQIFTGTGTGELNRYLQVNNSPGLQSASGLKAGGVLIADSYSYANPGKNDLVVKGKTGIGTASPLEKLHISGGNLILDNSGNPTIYTGTGGTELNRYLVLANSPTLGTGSGLKAGGILIADSYAYANPGKNDLIVKGKVGIGTPFSGNTNNYALAVNGKIGGHDVQIERISNAWSDYVFEADYKLAPLHEVEKFIKENGHLKDVPSAKEVEKDGYSVSSMDATLLRKIEELTLYILEQQKRFDLYVVEQQKQFDELKKQINKK